VVEAIDGGMSARAAGARFSVGISTAIKWHCRWRETGSLEPGRQGKPARSKLDAHEAFILDLVDGQKDMAREQGLQTCPATVWYFLSKRGLTHKKRRATPQSNSARMSSRGVKPGLTARSTSTRRV
jgi:transposase